MSESLEYRVRWQRGTRPKERAYRSRLRAQRQYAFLTSDPHRSCDHDGEDMSPPFCIWADSGTHDITEPPPWVIEPVIEVRSVAPWSPA